MDTTLGYDEDFIRFQSIISLIFNVTAKQNKSNLRICDVGVICFSLKSILVVHSLACKILICHLMQIRGANLKIIFKNITVNALKEFLAIRRVNSLNKTFVLFC